jgi:hypothetical protein
MWETIFVIVLKLLDFTFSKIASSEELKRKFEAFVLQAKDEGLISIAAKDEFERQKDELAKEVKPDKPS